MTMLLGRLPYLSVYRKQQRIVPRHTHTEICCGLDMTTTETWKSELGLSALIPEQDSRHASKKRAEDQQQRSQKPRAIFRREFERRAPRLSAKALPPPRHLVQNARWLQAAMLRSGRKMGAERYSLERWAFQSLLVRLSPARLQQAAKLPLLASSW